MPEPVQPAANPANPTETPATPTPAVDDKGAGNGGNPPVPEATPTPPAPAAPIDLPNASLEELAKSNGSVAELLKNFNDTKAELDRKAAADEEAKTNAAKEQGKFQELYENTNKELETEKGNRTKAEKLLGEYQGTVKIVLDAVLAGVPQEKLALIPSEYGERKRLEYVLNNAAALGIANPLKRGSNVPNNETEVQSDEAKDVARYQELLKKQGRSTVEQNELMDLARKIKQYQAEKNK